jgi:hypothetical protein
MISIIHRKAAVKKTQYTIHNHVAGTVQFFRVRDAIVRDFLDSAGFIYTCSADIAQNSEGRIRAIYNTVYSTVGRWFLVARCALQDLPSLLEVKVVRN